MLRLSEEGFSNRKIAQMIGMDKETVNNYMRKARKDELDFNGLLKLEDPVLEYRLKGGNPAYTDKRFEVFKELLPYLQDEMKNPLATAVGGIQRRTSRGPLQPHPVPFSLQTKHKGREGISHNHPG